MSVPNASCCSRNATIDRWVGKPARNNLNVSWQDPVLLEHFTGRVPSESEHRRRRLPPGSLCQISHKPCSSKSFTRTQICLMLCFLLCHHWVGMDYVTTSRYIYFWATVKLSKGIYRRRRYLKFPKQREEMSQAASPTNSPIYESRTGPKSSSHRRQVRTHLFVLMLFCITHKTGATKGVAEARVVADTSAATGAVSRLTMGMPTYSENTGEAGRSLANGLRWTAKRALRRARARAEKEGGARYRGRWYTAEQLSRTRQGVAPIPAEFHKSSASKATPVAKQETGKRIKCMTFNISGASRSAWQECIHWKGEGSRDFVSGPWFVVTTGAVTSDSKAGLAVLVHKRLGGPEQISVQTHLKGRLMHVRIHQGENSIDIINLYQHVWRSQLDKDSNTKCREGVWQKLRQVTTKIPQRNTLVVGGDFNCTIRRMRHHIGSAIVEAREPSPDQEEFLGYLQDHGMTLLNTWHAKPAYTCQTGDSQTQIDFLLCREQRADKTAKDSKPWHQAPIGKWKANHHVPVWASIRHIDPGRLPQKKLYKSYKTTLQGSVTLHDPHAQQLQAEVERKVLELTGTRNIPVLLPIADLSLTGR